MDYMTCGYCGYELAEISEEGNDFGDTTICPICGSIEIGLSPSFVKMIDDECLKELLIKHDISKLDIKHVEKNDPDLYVKVRENFIDEYFGKDYEYEPSSDEIEFAKLIVPIINASEDLQTLIESRNIRIASYINDNEKIRLVFILGDNK
jgi:hypothetical protein